MNPKAKKFLLSLSVALFILFLPATYIPIEGLSIIEQRVMALFVFAAMLWILEPIPIFATSILIIVLELLTISTSGIKLLVNNQGDNFGTILAYKDIMGTFASPIILLFLGGFFLAMASTKYRLDQGLARVLLKPFGKNPKMIMLGLMIITAIFSMFMSNTATTAMMLAILAPVLGYFDLKDPGRIAFALSIPFAANIGGIGTPIGTPPNALAMKYLTGENSISFGEWMAFGIPFVFILLIISWLLLLKFFPPKANVLEIEIKGKFMTSTKALIVYFTFGLTILLWLTDFLHGMNSYTVAMIPVAIFLALGIITKEDLKKMSWDVLWLVSGGIALGMALEKSGLAAHMVSSIPFDSYSPFLIVGIAVLLSNLMANFMSHTATANLLLPIVTAVGVSVISLNTLGGAKMLILATTMASSLGMALPISSPPNALAHATGMIESKDMSKVGVLIGIIGLVMVCTLMCILRLINFL
ncbi:SLC13 family permease [Reichenbachiella agarivorans]|uniref:SLC13 family permease n=1 Tax=Reichenbachiella agarivorans TaxID=2979464 RepID=A0ABY6CP17_9BACT|nr:SLC13 family permease [Reichenbachiella agarivorans]UXP32266.1 SLC13 family permease [Reichenbachiella agarivorans]